MPRSSLCGLFALSGLRGRWSVELGLGTESRWAVAKLVRHQALDLAFEGSNPSRPAKPKDDLAANESQKSDDDRDAR